jgi:hypothetical protein
MEVGTNLPDIFITFVIIEPKLLQTDQTDSVWFQVWQMAENIYNDEELDTAASEVEWEVAWRQKIAWRTNVFAGSTFRNETNSYHFSLQVLHR